MSEIIKIVDAILEGLNLIEVKGQSNLVLLYNSIQTLKNLKKSLVTPVVEEVKPNVANNSQ